MRLRGRTREVGSRCLGLSQLLEVAKALWFLLPTGSPSAPGQYRLRLASTARVAKWVDAGDLKSLGLRPCRFESCPGHPIPPAACPARGIPPGRGPVHREGAAFEARELLRGSLQEGFAHLVRLEELFESFAVEQCGALVVHFRQIDLDAEDLAGSFEDLADAQISRIFMWFVEVLPGWLSALVGRLPPSRVRLSLLAQRGHRDSVPPRQTRLGLDSPIPAWLVGNQE